VLIARVKFYAHRFGKLPDARTLSGNRFVFNELGPFVYLRSLLSVSAYSGYRWLQNGRNLKS
jgi:hypothetical protein